MRSYALSVLIIGLTATGCASDGKDTSSGETGTTPGTTDTDVPEPYDVEYEGQQFKVSVFSSYGEPEDGIDLDGDDEPDNNTPNALVLVDAFVPDQDLSVAGLNATVAQAIADETLILLMETSYTDSVLTYDVLTGLGDGAGGYSPADESYDDGGVPFARLEGYFTAGDAFYATADRVLVGITFFPDSPPFPMPIEWVTLEGSLDGDSVNASLYGAIPIDDLRDLLILPLLEEAYPDPKDRAFYLDLVDGALELETVADIDLGGGRRGVSCAFSFTAGPATW